MSRLLLDEHFAPKIAFTPQQRDIDAVAVAGHPQLQGTADDVVLEWATSHGYALLTENVRDFMPLFSIAMEREALPAGLIFTSPRSFPRSPDGRGRLIEALVKLSSAHCFPRPGEIHWL